MGQRSAGLLIYRHINNVLEVLLVHPGGPYWAKKDDGAWSIPKGLVNDAEDELSAARREAFEELGADINGEFAALGEYRQRSGKTVVAWAVQADFDADAIVSNSFEIEWPPHSGNKRTFPEIDRARWLPIAEAERKILKGQLPILASLLRLIDS
ncbi:NUDIX domain-containing protein [Rhizobium sp. 2YAF20]|uniref:NUDIX domain-containing protein n=1 Tax=Rhizobium sp. 2YAF20 TaxID=3233027 RepID=UPI003F9C6A0F